MDEEYIPDRITQAIEAVVAIYATKTQKPTPDEVSEMLSVFYEFSIKYDQFISQGEGNVIILSKVEP